jgi:thiamine-phosphate pyrophosphorylase
MICLVTDRQRLVTGSAGDAAWRAEDAGERLVELVHAAAAAGVDLVQIRERDLNTRQLLALVELCVSAVRGTSTRIVVNDRADVAIVASAAGVHLRSDSAEPAAIRSLLAPGALVGRSVHAREEIARIARSGGVDYFIFGTLFGSGSKGPGHRLSSMDELAGACRETRTPILAIGGITIERAELVARAGAAGIAAIGLFLPPAGISPRAHLEPTVASLRRVFDTCRVLP